MKKIHELLTVALHKFEERNDFLCVTFRRCHFKKNEREFVMYYLYQNRPDKRFSMVHAFWYFEDMESRRQWLIKHIQITKEADI